LQHLALQARTVLSAKAEMQMLKMRKTVLGHLEELRWRVTLVAGFFLLVSVFAIYFSGWFVEVLVDNLTRNIDVVFVSLSPFEFIATQIKLGFFIGLVLTVPVIAFELGMFVRPALRKKERWYLYLAVPVSVLLFGVGFVFAYFIFLKVALVFLGNLGVAHGVENMWSIGVFVSTVFFTCVVIGALFEMPVVAWVLSRIGVLKKGMLASKRVYVYVLLFIVAAAITPPDVVTQILIAVPMILLYEVSMLLVRK
jgi:sec-independent protein translocase protein TatC